VLAPRQGDVHYCHFSEPIKSRPVLILSRNELNIVRENIVVALITRTIRGVPLEVPVGLAEGLPKEGVVSVADIHTVPKTLLSPRLGALSTPKRKQIEESLALLFDLDR